VSRSVVARLAAGWLALAALLVGCDKDKDVAPPATLVPFAAKLSVQRLWDASLGGKDRALRLALAPAADDKRIYAAGPDGSVHAFDALSGRSLWRVNSKLGLSAGPGVGAGLVVTGTSDGQVLALDAATGARRWLIRTSGEVLAQPVIGPQSVIVRTVDGRVRALALDTGRELWSNEQQVPRLSLRGTAVPAIAGDTVVCGFDNGKVAAYSINNGDLLWEASISPPRGKTELERLVDIDGRIEVSGHDVFVAGFQGRVAMLALDSGQVWWSRELSSYRGLVLDGEILYITTAEGSVQALRRRDGTPIWDTDKLIRRGLTTPVIDGGAVVVADFEGFVHWLDKDSGEIIARMPTKKKERITNAPLVANGVVYVQNDAGRLWAFRAHKK